MIIADDQHYVCGEPHGSSAQWVYAACSRNPKNLDELDKLLPELGADRDLRELFHWSSSLDLEPVDAGLIIVDLAKKWIFAEDTYFGAHRRGWCQSRLDDDKAIEYEFSSEWQFVAEAKWFRYLQNCGLTPFGEPDAAFHKSPIHYEEISWDDIPMPEENARPAEIDEDESWDDERSGIEVVYINRACSLVDFMPRNAVEERDLQTLEHINRYDEKAAMAQHRIEKARKEIDSFRIEWQAADNLWTRTGEPRWALKRIKFQAEIERQERRISHWAEEQSEAAAMAAELRSLIVSEKGHGFLKTWEQEEKNDGDHRHDGEIPF
jgi:hypothetical protein